MDVYTSKARADKAISSLKGILLGIYLDDEVNEKEINELKQCVVAQNVLNIQNPYFAMCGFICLGMKKISKIQGFPLVLNNFN